MTLSGYSAGLDSEHASHMTCQLDEPDTMHLDPEMLVNTVAAVNYSKVARVSAHLARYLCKATHGESLDAESLPPRA